MLRIIKDIRPTWVIGENVANFARMELDSALSDLEGADYEATAFNIPACGVNAWHKRERIFIVAHTRHNAGSTKQIMQPEISKESATSNAGQICSGSTSNTISTERPQLRNLPRMGWGMEYDPWDGSCLWESEPNVGRVVDGVSKGLDEFRRQSRCHSLGNAVVPQQVYPILKAIAEKEKGMQLVRVRGSGMIYCRGCCGVRDDGTEIPWCTGHYSTCGVNDPASPHYQWKDERGPVAESPLTEKRTDKK